jgi:alpha-beta hydrolase superfamily lysophospholipase
MRTITLKWLKRTAVAAGLILGTVLAVRAFDAWRSPPLALWHSEAPHELHAAAIDGADWAGWRAAEVAAFDEVRSNVTDQLPDADRIPTNRYFSGSPMHGSRFATDWNRSYVQLPEAVPLGAVVLLHGLTDSPYSLRHIGESYRQRGFAVVAIRLPGHGTVPAGLVGARWEDWTAATRLAVRHARSLAGAHTPLHLVGYSNGGALALKYTLEALDDPALARPDQLVLLSPMVGITSFARFAGVLGWPAVFPAFAKSAWLDTLPEYNPFKYNSFPVNGARQSSQMTEAVRKHMLKHVEAGTLAGFPRVLTFQSVVDSTVFTAAVIENLYQVLPANGSELVLFDLNHQAKVGPLIRPGITATLKQILESSHRNFVLTLVTSSAADTAQVEARSFGAGVSEPTRVALSQAYPRDMYSLSHVALPFPMDDPVYGQQPSEESFGVRLGMLAVRGERGTLIVDVGTLMRATCNPFYDYQLEKLLATLPAQ